MNRNVFTISLIFFTLAIHFISAQDIYFNSKYGKLDFTISNSGKSAPIHISNNDFPGVIRAVNNLKTDVGKVSDAEPELFVDQSPVQKEIVIVGTVDKNNLIQQLIKNKKIDVSSLTGKWETFLIQTVEKPFPNIDRALVITGSDKRGTIFGIYEISRKIGVSPWYWWADVAPQKNKNIFIQEGSTISGEPSVKYRGIFLNDEEPSLGRWAVEKYGGFNHNFYEKVFELILRLKGNYLWPAMWWASFNSDDKLNQQLADEYGIIMGTSHHEPMMRAHAEWKKTGTGDWNYETNAIALQKFWREGIERMSSRESIITLAMRGDGDMAMLAETKTALLEKIVRDQRDIIADVTKKEVTKFPQLWAIYKEVQDYYDKGMRVPDDVTLLFCDDNWGNIRKLPGLNDKKRTGGYGIYYHFDYVGDPRNYKWLNTNPITKIWEQMHLAKEYGADRIWIVNVGDLKPMEFPISFFLDYAWDTKKWNQNNLNKYTDRWCEEQFGKTYAKEIANIISKYTKFNGRRKPELITSETYSIINYYEAESIVKDYRDLEKEADAIYDKLQRELKDAYYQLVLYPVKACANLNDIYVTTGKNMLYARQGRSSTNDLAGKVKKLYQDDSLLTIYYNKKLAGGKWNNMMNQIHFGYTNWQDPKVQVMPEVRKIENITSSEMGLAVEGSEKFWIDSSNEAALPEFNSLQKSSHYFEIFNRGKTPFDFSIKSNVGYLKFSKPNGTIEKEERIYVDVDWTSVPEANNEAVITITGSEKKLNVFAKIRNQTLPKNFSGFVEIDRCISIEPEHFSRAINSNQITWQILPDYGRTLSGITPFPVTSPQQKITNESPHLEYDIHISDTTTLNVQFIFGATLAFNANAGMQFGVSVDNESPQIININKNDTPKTWSKVVEDNARHIYTIHKVSKSGKHVLKYWMVDPGIVLQKIIIDTGGLRSSYLGPPETMVSNTSNK
ncbi:MAG: glycosyl hydrolase 115 family protein [Cyclobacteriaceae bacterium]